MAKTCQSKLETSVKLFGCLFLLEIQRQLLVYILSLISVCIQERVSPTIMLRAISDFINVFINIIIIIIISYNVEYLPSPWLFLTLALIFLVNIYMSHNHMKDFCLYALVHYKFLGVCQSFMVQFILT